MPRTASVSLNHKGMGELLNSSEVGNMLMDKMRPALLAAQADPHDDTYAYERGLALELDHTDRAVARLVSRDRKGHILEAEYGILARALDQAR